MTQQSNETEREAQAVALGLAPVAGRLLATQAVAPRGAAFRRVGALAAQAIGTHAQASRALDQAALVLPQDGLAGLVERSSLNYLTLDEAAQIARVTRGEIVRMVGTGELRAYRFGKSRKLISVASFLAAFNPIRPGSDATEEF